MTLEKVQEIIDESERSLKELEAKEKDEE